MESINQPWCSAHILISSSSFFAFPFHIAHIGKKSNKKQFDTYGDSYGKGDTIGCFINCDQGTISFSKNGTDLGKYHQSVQDCFFFFLTPSSSSTPNKHMVVFFNFKKGSRLKFQCVVSRSIQPSVWRMQKWRSTLAQGHSDITLALTAALLMLRWLTQLLGWPPLQRKGAHTPPSFAQLL